MESPFHKIRVRLDHAGRGQIEFDGMPLKGVYRTEITTDAEEISRVKLSMFASEIDVETEAGVTIEATKPSVPVQEEA